MTFEGQTALVTGGAVRIGREICLALAGQGARVLVHYRRSAGEARELVRRIRSSGGEARALAADFDRDGACDELMKKAFRLSGPVDILVNNAAVFHRDTFRTMTGPRLEAEFRTNLFVPLLLIGAFARQDRPGQVVNVLDRRVTSLDTERVPYVLSKKALAEATRLAALALAPAIRVNAVAPGPALPPPGEAASSLREKAGPIPLERTSGPAEIAGAVCFLLTQPGVTGQTLFVDGGQHLIAPEAPSGRAGPQAPRSRAAPVRG